MIVGEGRPPRPRRRFGQHFLTDPSVIERIVAVIRPVAGQHLVEIGPGRGALTRPLLEVLGTLDVVEIDRELARALCTDLGPIGELRVHRGDALRFDFSGLAPPGERLRIVGNLPYNISTPLLFHLLAHSDAIQDMVFMLQREVAERIVAAPGNRDYGRLSVMLQFRCDATGLFAVAPHAFRPEPQVHSTVIRLVPRPPATPVADHGLFERLVRQAFGQRRKTLRNALRGWLDEGGFGRAGINPTLRAETLAVADFVRLANELTSGPGP
ncbi:MAG: 16S rRNA (adenine(1518)-N(6)/adenine(1519)-N(6))-dimethyltransferase RsmA [Gammaproteobacteria bacterium]